MKRKIARRLGARWAALTLAFIAGSCSAPTGPPSGLDDGGISVVTGQVFVGAGDIASCDTDDDELTAQLLDGIAGTVFTLGDNAYPNGRDVDYRDCYEPTWGRHKARTYAALGNHEYDTGSADASFDYFGDRVGPRGLGYYSFDLDAWHIIVLNDNEPFVPFSAGSAQDQWLVADLAANTKRCTLAIWHQPLFYSNDVAGGSTVRQSRQVLWERLYAARVDVVMNGHSHHYERFAPMDPDGNVNAQGLRSFVIGTGGKSSSPSLTIAAHSEVRSDAIGVMKLTLGDGAYAWRFVPVPGTTFTDSGMASCHGPPA